jgi:hypothetical protein
MFLDNSRYAKLAQVEVTLGDGRKVKAVKLRRLPQVKGEPTTIKGNDRLDIMAQRAYGEPTWFWHIADANSEEDATALVAETGRTIKVPAR